MRIFVMTETYTSESGRYENSYIHTRNLLYRDAGHSVRVLSFRARGRYEVDGIEVYREADVLRECLHEDADIWLLHAPNLRNHLRFARRHHRPGTPLVVFFHGHECLSLRKYYPRPYRFAVAARRKRALAIIYDPLKLLVMRRFVSRVSRMRTTRFVFVSRWMRDETFRSLRLEGAIAGRVSRRSVAIHNAVHPAFLEERYQRSDVLLADFVTIRPLDRSKHAVDRVIALARRNNQFSFDIYGRGSLPEHIQIPPNVRVHQTYLAQHDIPALLNRYAAAIMPTRLDAQGVMVCEMASYGIPVLTSDLPVCDEMVGDFPGVVLFDHSTLLVDLHHLVSLGSASAEMPDALRLRFSAQRTVNEELALFASVASGR
jgi:glycosyltransferase involved in cell wall biosynthesis